MLGYDDNIAGEIGYVEHREEGDSHLVLSGDYEALRGRWHPGELPIGQKLREPEPLFRKLDPELVVAEELARMEAAAAGGGDH
jgi:methionyl-tRNA synthetase